MKIKRKQCGLSLTEILTSLVIVVLLAAISMPALRALLNSMSSTGSCEAMISAALSNTRAIAMREQRYAGVRFQMEGSQNTPGWPFNADQYMIFIIHDNQGTGLANGFRVVNGFKPIRLPDNVRVTDLTLGTNPLQAVDDTVINDNNLFNDISTFSIVFSPQGNLVVHDVRVKEISNSGDVFNTDTNINATSKVGMFYQDSSDGRLGLKEEQSRREFIIYEQDKFRNAFNQGKAYSGYLIQLQLNPIYLNPYTGAIISTGTGK